MNTGAFSAAIRADLLRFNGKLFKEPRALRLDRPPIELFIKAAEARWDQVEPAIFGTLLERALDPRERHRLGAHYTPRAYVERLVLPAVIEPLREEWKTAQAAALTLREEATSRTPWPKYVLSRTGSVRCAFSIRPAAPATSSTSPWSTSSA